MGIHLIELEKNHVEFRYLGGEYSSKFKQVKEVIANYAHWLSIACDPEYKRREYITKVSRMANYYNYLYLQELIETFEYNVKVHPNMSKVKNWVKISETYIKPYRNKIKSLPSTHRSEKIQEITKKAQEKARLLFDKLLDKVKK